MFSSNFKNLTNFYNKKESTKIRTRHIGNELINLTSMNVSFRPLEIVAETAKDFLQKVITPPLEEVGLLLADSIKLWRFKNQINILNKAETYLKTKNITTRKVSLKILAPLIEQCSFEESEDLQNKWAILLSNIVRADSTIETTLYSHILSQLTSKDAEIFKIIYNHCASMEINGENVKLEKHQRAFFVKQLWDIENADMIVDNLLRLRVIKELNIYSVDTESVTLTQLGFNFMNACTVI